MAQIHADPEKLREFAQQLKRFDEQVSGSSQAIRGQLQKLGSSWRDSQYQEFVENFNRAQQFLATFSAEVDKIVPTMTKHAHDLDELLKR